jgi:hypothetical protein
MAADGSSGGLTGILAGGDAQSVQFRERARKARAIAGRYRGAAAAVLHEIAEDFDARAAVLETQLETQAV